jgi:hypothetical protein
MLISCASGYGVVREEMWEDSSGVVIRYNLAFINPFLAGVDNGRVLGYDNAHGEHHRHFYGSTERISISSFEALSTMFYKEVAALRRRPK